jgi:hypothetical protein
MEKSNLPECHEGPEAGARFDGEIRFLLSVPHATVVRRGKAYRKKTGNQTRRVPKRRMKPASGPSAV